MCKAEVHIEFILRFLIKEMPVILLTATEWGACILQHQIMILDLQLSIRYSYNYFLTV